MWQQQPNQVDLSRKRSNDGNDDCAFSPSILFPTSPGETMICRVKLRARFFSEEGRGEMDRGGGGGGGEREKELT